MRMLGKAFTFPKKRKLDATVHQVAKSLDFSGFGPSTSMRLPKVGITDVYSALKMLQALQDFVSTQQHEMELQIQIVDNSGV